ncbi:MAG: hypothetical protein B6D77_19005 [gamma proteobacterium symbiont of Ctena orbiculata]|nr:MAG: hypothetical protein B6D77_19005 [gamma proteobacterium symbiont of Ctena orbiculata]PVV23663.1 MAG: hypothetical protein B6D78_02675 [gamma proteobacterium symbiont of Ctena orbiculata]
MVMLVIKGWSAESAWLQNESWSQIDYCQRLYHCTYLRGRALNCTAESLLKREACEFQLVSREHAEALTYTLESAGAQFEIKHLWPEKVISLDLYRKGTEVKTITQAMADAR